MAPIRPVDPNRMSFVIDRDFNVRTLEHKPGPPERPDGLSVGIVEMHTAPPHGGEMHPDGDEVIYIISGRVRVLGDSTPGTPLELGPGGACIIPKGEWHNIEILEPVKLIYITPGPGGEHRPMK
jgi:mannose-6-phosphate isomerase-like protein (cupin superfamily)